MASGLQQRVSDSSRALRSPKSVEDLLTVSSIKLSNVMLGSPNPKNYPGYPSPIMVDWGFAQVVPPDVVCKGRGCTPECASPETTGFYVDQHNVFHQGPALTHKADVWGVGNVILGLLSGREGDAGLDFLADPRPRDVQLRKLRGSHRSELLDLIDACMKYHPEDRIDFDTLLKRIRENTGRPGLDLSLGMRNRKASDELWTYPMNALEWKEDKWGLYTKLTPRFPPVEGDPVTLSAPPHPTRRLAPEDEYMGPVLADNKAKWDASEQKKHAETHTRLEHVRWLQQRGRKGESTGQKSGTFAVPDSEGSEGSYDSDDSNFSDDSDTHGLPQPFSYENAATENDWQTEAAADDDAMMIDSVSPRLARRSRSAAAGAGDPQQEAVEASATGPARNTRSSVEGRNARESMGSASMDLESQEPSPRGTAPRLSQRQQAQRRRSSTAVTKPKSTKSPSVEAGARRASRKASQERRNSRERHE